MEKNYSLTPTGLTTPINMVLSLHKADGQVETLAE